MSSNVCPDVAELRLLLDEQLEPARTAEVVAHVESCCPGQFLLERWISRHDSHDKLSVEPTDRDLQSSSGPTDLLPLESAQTEGSFQDANAARRRAEASQQQLKSMAKSIVLKDVQSPERLLDETGLFLHRVVADLPIEKQKMLERLHSSNEILHGRKMLVVDDDARNIFALTSLLERYEIEVVSATNGSQAIDLIRNTADLSMVLMDIMMPDMDGYRTIAEIRKDPRFRSLPILALTAKAMKGDREKCLDAGASDYIAKPVNAEQLLSLMRVWLFL
jgi:CheY-like chemotaxis protein